MHVLTAIRETSNCWINCQGVLRFCSRKADLCSEWRGLCETTDQLIIVFYRSRRFPTDNFTRTCHCSICQAVYSIVHALPAISRGHHGFEDTNTECPNMIRNEPVGGLRQPVSSLDVFHYLDLECNHRTQYLLTMVCVLLYIFLKSDLTFFWICSSTLKVNLWRHLFFPCWK